MKFNQRTALLIALLLLVGMGLFAQSKPVKPLHNGWYSAKQLRSRGYNADFKGRQFITYKKYLELVNDTNTKTK